jgi:hypothetical protein
MPITIVEQFISEEDCKRYLSFLEPKATLSERTQIMNALGYPSSLVASKIGKDTGVIPGEQNEINFEIGELFEKIKAKAEDVFGEELDLCNANYQMLPKGSSNPMHSDTTKDDGSPLAKDGSPEEVEWSGLLYLNTNGKDFEGGTLYFEKQDLEYFPKAGDLVIFRGDMEHRHEVRTVLEGERKNLVFFWAKRGNVSDGNRFDVDYT